MALHFVADEPAADGEAAVSLGLVVIRGGRVVLSDAGEQTLAPHERIGEPLRALLGCRYLIAWSTDVATTLLERIFGGDPRRGTREPSMSAGSLR